MTPGVGAVADVANAVLHAAKGNYKDAGTSLLGAIPGAGQAVTAGKLASKAAKLSKVKKSSNAFRDVLQGTKVIRKNANKGGKKAPQVVGIREKPGKTMKDALKDFNSLVDKSSIKNVGNGVRIGKTRNGDLIKVRPSSDGRPTLEIIRKTKDNKKKTLKIRYGNPEEGNKQKG